MQSPLSKLRFCDKINAILVNKGNDEEEEGLICGKERKRLVEVFVQGA